MNLASELIKKLITEGKHTEALKKIEELLSMEFDLTKKPQEELYTELIHLRVTAKTLSDIHDDDVILDLVRKEKYPSKQVYQIGQSKILLQYKNQFLERADAYVNTVHSKSLFNEAEPYSARYEFVKRIGLEEIKSQLSKYKNFIEGSFIKLKHPTLTAPMSYHIVYDRDYFDKQVLKDGLFNVLGDAVLLGLKTLNIFPLTFDLVHKAHADNKDNLAQEIANAIADTIYEFIDANKNKHIPELHFNFVRTNTMQVFDRAFYRVTRLSKSEHYILKSLSLKQEALIQGAVTDDPKYIEILKELSYSLDDKSTILITGETGVGKSFLAGIIHKNSNRAAGKLQKLNCALLEKEHLISTLFGWKKGSFTDAKEDGKGAVEEADGGSLFLDEIGYTSPIVQRKLLTFVQEGIYNRHGDSTERKADVRLIFGTNVDLQSKMQSGEFQEDFYYRIKQITLEIPPLRERTCDIIKFSKVFIDKLNQLNTTNIALSEIVLNKLTEYKWPGNVRQLDYYISAIYNRAIRNNCTIIPIELVLAKPPDDTFYRKMSKFTELEKILNEYLMGWDVTHGNMLTNLIEPILSNLYLSNPANKKTEAKKYVGIDGKSGSVSTIDTRLHEYKTTKDKFDI